MPMERSRHENINNIKKIPLEQESFYIYIYTIGLWLQYSQKSYQARFLVIK